MIHLICTLEASKIVWLPQFVAHYRSLGVEQFLLTLQQDPALDQASRQANHRRFKSTLDGLGIALSFELLEPYDSMSLTRHHERISDQFVSEDDWMVWCDSDEFQLYPAPLRDLIAECVEEGVQAISGFLIDRIAADGSLPAFDPAQSIWSLYPYCCNVTAEIAHGVTRKMALCGGGVKPGLGNHYLREIELKTSATRWIQIHHFKWHSGVIAQLQYRVRPEWRSKCAWWIESQRMLDYFTKNNMCFNLNELAASDPATTNWRKAIPDELIATSSRDEAKTIVLQAYDAPFVPDWIKRCLDSVRLWCAEQSFAYEFLSEGFFLRSPVWFRDRCGTERGPVTDLSRLLLMQDLFDQGYEKVIWIDADVLVFNPSMLKVKVARGLLAIYEMTLGVQHDGSVSVTGPTVNGAIMGARRNDPVFGFYRHAAAEVVRTFRGNEVPRTIAGPSLLTEIARIVPIECLTTVGLFTPAMLVDIADSNDRLARLYMEKFGFQVAAANLCHFFRSNLDSTAQNQFDAVMLKAIDRLIASKGDCINRFLPSTR